MIPKCAALNATALPVGNGLHMGVLAQASSHFQAHMRLLRLKNNQVALCVVALIAVLVMHDFARTKGTPQHLCRNQPMGILRPHSFVPRRMRGLISSSAQHRAIFTAALLDIGAANVKRGSAVHARAMLATFARDGITSLRAPLAPARLATVCTNVHEPFSFFPAAIIADMTGKVKPWFSPHCRRPDAGQGQLFGGGDA